MCSKYVVILEYNSPSNGTGIENVWSRNVGVFRLSKHQIDMNVYRLSDLVEFIFVELKKFRKQIQ